MACWACRHFEEDEHKREELYKASTGIIESVEQLTGNCTYWPQWEEVTGLHYCSQFSPKTASMIGYWWRAMHQKGQELQAERKRRLDADKKVAELRKEIKAMQQVKEQDAQ